MRFSLLRLTALCGATFLAVACQDGLAPSPTNASAGAPRISAALAPAAAGSGIVLDQQNGSLSEPSTSVFLKGFNPTNPHRGDAIVATFFWVGTTNIYTLVDYHTAGGLSMATYVAINVQNFPDAYGTPGGVQDSILAVEGDLSQPVSQGGMQIAAYTGVGPIAAFAVGAHTSTDGTGSGITVLGPGPIAVGAGALVHAVALTNGIFGYFQPSGYSEVGEGDNPAMKEDAEFFVSGAVSTSSPQWNWFYDSQSYTWLSAALVLNPPLHLVLTVQPSNTLPLMTITPAVQVAAEDASGNTVTGFTGSVTIAIGHNGGTLTPGTLSGTKTVTVVNGVATFSDLSIDQLGNGYTLVVSAPNVTGAESAPFNIGAF